MSIGLLQQRGFRALFLAQLLGAFNDNVFKILVSLLTIETAAVGHTGGYLSLAGAVFMAPYLLLSGYAGYAADFFEKRRVLIAVKAFEIAIMALALAALIRENVNSLLTVLFLLGAQATFFSPAKYGIVPELLPEPAWPRANGLLELGRYAATIVGTAAGGVVLLWWRDRPSIIGLLMLAISIAGFAASLCISRVPRSGTNKRFRLDPWSELAIGMGRLADDTRLMSAVAGISFFEFIGALVLLDMLLVGKEVMALDDGLTSLLGAFAGLGIAIGSVAAGHLSRGRVEVGLVPFGATGVGLGVMILCVVTASYPATAGIMVLVGLAGGFIIVPLYGALQKQASGTERGRLISTNNFLNMAAVLLSSAALWVLHDILEINSRNILLIAGLTTLAATLAALWGFPGYASSATAWARSQMCKRNDARASSSLQAAIWLRLGASAPESDDAG
jgi:acyl-[acyl-carrier-protein]-phospholipid O-acyltransferase/long-chain-fatty-acid--[acyl-carrier-protein] ligase